MTYLQELASELNAVGIRGGLRRRILVEVEDHLAQSRDVAAFGPADLVARRFADELAISGARRAAWRSFLALAPAGIAYPLLLSLPAPWPNLTAARTVPLAVASVFVVLLAPQVSFAAGLLAVAQAWRLRSEPTAPAGAVTVLRRRAAVALSAGAAALVAVMLMTYEFTAWLPGWRILLAFGAAGAAMLPIAYAAAGLRRTVAIRPQAAGPPGDVFDDLAPVVDRIPVALRGRPWHFCLLFAAAVALLALIGGGLEEGPRNAVAEFGAICGGFAVLGRFLGLR